MKIKFKKKRFIIHLILGVIWILTAILSFLNNEEYRWFDYFYLFTGIAYLFIGFYDYKNQYLIIENGKICKNRCLNLSFKKIEINLNEINQITNLAGIYILKTTQNQLKIDTELIAKDSLLELDRILTELNLPLDV